MEGAIWFWFKQTVMGLLAAGWIYNQYQAIRHRLAIQDLSFPTPKPFICPVPPVITVLPNCSDVEAVPCVQRVKSTVLPMCNATDLSPCILQERNHSALSNDSGTVDPGDIPLVEPCVTPSSTTTTAAPVTPPTKVNLHILTCKLKKKWSFWLVISINLWDDFEELINLQFFIDDQSQFVHLSKLWLDPNMHDFTCIRNFSEIFFTYKIIIFLLWMISR